MTMKAQELKLASPEVCEGCLERIHLPSGVVVMGSRRVRVNPFVCGVFTGNQAAIANVTNSYCPGKIIVPKRV